MAQRGQSYALPRPFDGLTHTETLTMTAKRTKTPLPGPWHAGQLAHLTMIARLHRAEAAKHKAAWRESVRLARAFQTAANQHTYKGI